MVDVSMESKTEGLELDGNAPGYALGKIVIALYARYVTNGDSHKEFHDLTMLNVSGIAHSSDQNVVPKFITIGCDNMDHTGYCLGHKTTREAFIRKWCAGVEPPQLRS